MSNPKQDILDEQLPIIGVSQWVNNGFTGQNVNVWNMESNNSHGAKTRQVILDVAPNANVISAGVSAQFDGDKILYYAVEYNGITYLGEQGVSDFIEEFEIDIVSASLTGYAPHKHPQEFIDMWKRLQKKHNLIILNAAGNEGDNAQHETITTKLPIEVAMCIGALGYIKYGKKPKVVDRQGYSSVGDELDFSQFVLWFSGTSAATPCLAGQCALLIGRYGEMHYQEMYKYLKMISDDLGEAGDDVYYGWGQPILPEPHKKYITMTTKSNDYYVNGVKHQMDTKPVNINGNVFVPVRVISETLGATVNAQFNKDKTIKVLIDRGNSHIELNTEDTLAYINGKKYYLNEAPFIDENNRTLVPIRFIAESLGCMVDWVQPVSKVMILEK